ncbi:MAG: ABC transporter substrate-binding protein, partial [Rikenellaceae bacterium]|nr:ABC transporter substrate-binding protein [Rikenellaceae bacterium]
ICGWMLAGCAGGGDVAWQLPAGVDTLYMPRYAAGFELYGLGKSTLMRVKNPWQGARGVEKWVFLARDGERAPSGFDGTVVEAPVGRAVCMSSSHVAFLDALGAADAVCGVSGGRFITNPAVREGLERGTVRDVGTDQSVNFELVAALKPDVLLTYGLAGESSVATDKMREMAVPVVYIGEYVEDHPLGKAEWVVALGEMLGRRKEAVALFDSVVCEYDRVSGLARDVEARPEVMLNSPWRDTWFVPGDRSYMVRLIDDAGGAYVCRGEDTEQSRPIGIEAAFVAIGKADVWLGPGAATTLGELLAENPRFRDVPPVRAGRVYNNNLRRTPEGGSDFWESGTVYPNIVLKDMIRILHPELLPDHELYYFRKLE